MKSVFSKIISGEIPGSFVYRDELVVAFLDISQFNPGHTLVVPTKEVSSFSDLDEQTGGRMFRVAGLIAKALPLSVQCAGVNLLLSDGAVAGQEVFHAHLHVIPRFAGDEIRWQMPVSNPKPSRETLDSIASKLRDGLNALN